MDSRSYSVLFLCTGNSARSIMAETILRHHGDDRFRAFSAGSRPLWRVNKIALETLARHGVDTSGVRSKSWDEFSAEGAPALDFVFTLCDAAAGEQCPVWPGDPVTAHWGVPDPAAIDSVGELERVAAFRVAYRVLERRVLLFVNLPLASLDRLSLQAQIREIGTR